MPTTPLTTVASLSQAAFVKDDQNIVFVPKLTLVPAVGSTAGQTYAVAGFHFHNGNEHVIDGRPELELHVKTTFATNRTAVFAVLWERDDSAPADPFLTAALQSVRTQGASVDLTPALRHFTQLPFYSYEGSLTTPPCTAGIRWYVLEHTIKTSRASIMSLVDALVAAGKPVNNRRQAGQLQTEAWLVTPR